jgi:flavin-binding protein dodecin
MSDAVYKHIKVTGTSPNSMEEAVQNALARVGKNVKNMSWFQLVETRGAIKDDSVAQWQVTVEVGFRVED